MEMKRQIQRKKHCSKGLRIAAYHGFTRGFRYQIDVKKWPVPSCPLPGGESSGAPRPQKPKLNVQSSIFQFMVLYSHDAAIHRTGSLS